MRKALFLAFMSILVLNVVNAQYVNLPDSNFRNILMRKYPSCFNASGQLDTTCNRIITEDTLYAWGAANLDGLQYFKALVFLNCLSIAQGTAQIPSLPATLQTLEVGEFTNLTTLPVLPTGLQYLSCTNVNLQSLPALPPSLKKLSCIQTTLSSLPGLPASLTYLDCRIGNISILPSLPAGLEYLYCGDNPLQALPALPDSIKEIDCSNNYLYTNVSIGSIPALPSRIKKLSCKSRGITTLPALPASLETLDCSNNLLLSLPMLPPSLKELKCSNNNLGTLPSLPDSLYSLFCENDSLTSLPALPSQLRQLHCANNKLTSLPEFPGTIIILNCENNDIYCLPVLPASDTLQARSEVDGDYRLIWIDSGKIKCIPNLPPGFMVLSGNQYSPVIFTTICNRLNNPNHCQAFPAIIGSIFYDNNSNGVKDNNEFYKANLKVGLSDGTYTYSDTRGHFELYADTLGTFSISPVSPDYFNLVPASATYNFTSYDTIVSTNYALQASAVADSLILNLTAVNFFARPGVSFPYTIYYENAGTTTLSPTIVLNYDETILNYNTSSVVGVVDNADKLTYNPGSLVSGASGSITGYFTLKSTAAIGDVLGAKAEIVTNTFSAYDSVQTNVRSSYDPNDKQATPQLSPSQVANGEYIDYTIRFQNTGTDTAFTVVISDTLSDDLQANTLQMTASSHNCKTTVIGNIIFFEFLNILLPDSNVNEPLSHGFVSFRIKPQTNVAVNTTIPNKAAIYFDYNAPVITNTAGTLIKDLIVLPMRLISFTGVPQNDNTTFLYWNTLNEINTQYFVVEKSNDGSAFTSTTSVFAKGRANNHYNSTVADPNTGIVFYRLKIVDNNGSFVYSPVIKIDRRKNTAGFSLLSNPVKDFIIINTPDRSLHNTLASIINMQGAVVKTFIVKEGNQTIPIKDLPVGVYYLKTTNGSSRFVVQ